MDELQAAMLAVKIDYLDAENERRREIAEYYCAKIKNPLVTLPRLPENREEHVWHLFVVRCGERDGLREYLAENYIQTLIHYPVPPHKQACYPELNALSLPVTELIHREVLSLPISPVMTEAEVEKVVGAVNGFRG
jgi:dTDP-4-amino-4,6-dideoxygalactose transaminase